ncbi:MULTISPECIES: LPFR motif small protein [unclassified Streptomyces]|uniref:LPFR motif small protein n=1 Tax=unclassified Streptomyces TaxID=2593676 RepID=UPI003D8C19EB
MVRAIADVLRRTVDAVAAVVTLPFRAPARLSCGVPATARGGARRVWGAGRAGRSSGGDRPARPETARVPALSSCCRCDLPQLPRNLSGEGGTGS